MKRLFLLPFALPSFVATAQDADQKPTGPSAAEVAATLKPEQIANVLKQLEELEKSALAQRGTSLGGIIQRLRSAASSDAAAMNFLQECDEVVNVTRKGNDRESKEEAERRAEAQKRREQNRDKEDVEKDGDPALALRLSLEYLALTLEASEAKDIAAMVPKLEGYHKSLLASAANLKGASGESLMRPIAAERGADGRRGGLAGGGGVGVVVAALQLEPYLDVQDWSLRAGDIMDHYGKVMLKLARQDHKDKLGQVWETAINTEAAYRKGRVFEGEFLVWSQSAVPEMRWQRAMDVLTFSPTPVNGLADMLAVIKANPGHPSVPSWIKQLRGYVQPRTEAAVTTGTGG